MKINPPCPPQIGALLLAVCLVTTAPLYAARAQEEPTPPQAQPQQVTSSILLRWRATSKVDRYRVQVALDQQFRDIVFDSAVTGLEHRVTGLAPGTYYWRVAPVSGETGRYSRPAPVVVSAESPGGAKVDTNTAVAPPVIDASNAPGWRTATGEVAGITQAVLRAGRGADFVCVNRDGTTHALDGVTGVALWAARYRPQARRGEPTGSLLPVTFAPLVARLSDDRVIVAAAFDGGVRGLRGDTGREAWRAPLAAGIASAGAAFDLNNDGRDEFVVVAGNPSTLYVIDAETGKVSSQAALVGQVLDVPFPFKSGADARIALSYPDGTVELRDSAGAVVRSIKLEGPATTAPLVLQTPVVMLLAVGSEKGLEALNADDLSGIGRIVTESDTVRGRLASIDLDRDGNAEVVLVTKRGRVAVVGTTDGRIRWYAEGAADAGRASFADLNGDGVLDILAPAGGAFAYGFSGRDGTLLWKADELGKPLPTSAPADAMRVLVVANVAGDKVHVVGAEPSRVGVRAVELPQGAGGSR